MEAINSGRQLVELLINWELGVPSTVLMNHGGESRLYSRFSLRCRSRRRIPRCSLRMFEDQTG